MADRRITPACAGKSRGWESRCSRWRDHPRVRGEKDCASSRGPFVLGSPPRARGKVRVFAIDPPAPGITPACAGKSEPSCPRKRRAEDHPRVRGEKLHRLVDAQRKQGSPPRAPGKAQVRLYGLHAVRITPACAGKRRRWPAAGCSCWDHPRVRGEKRTIAKVAAAVAGSPPRARGKVEAGNLDVPGGGITPACAGKRTVPAAGGLLFWDHPRVRGEKFEYLPLIHRLPGSPPRARGKANRHAHANGELRITPACAGKRCRYFR